MVLAQVAVCLHVIMENISSAGGMAQVTIGVKRNRLLWLRHVLTKMLSSLLASSNRRKI